MTALPAGSVIGILGGGQLGRMLALAAAPLGYRVHIYAPDEAPCAFDVAWKTTRAAYNDQTALAAFANAVDVMTFEFENVPVAPLMALAPEHLNPSIRALEVTQDRAVEKRFAESLNIRTAPWAEVPDRAALDAAISDVGTPAILKTSRFGYDGKGQARLTSSIDADEAWDTVGGHPSILEGQVKFAHEFSLVVARDMAGNVSFYDAPENVHRDGILYKSSLPAPPLIVEQTPVARTIARRVAEALNYVGVFAVEFFACADGPMFNEIAPRVHNSGHWTIEAAETSQFENHIRAICGLTLGATTLTGQSVEMINLIGDDITKTPQLISERGAHLHNYGKGAPSPGRKMGHVTRVVR